MKTFRYVAVVFCVLSVITSYAFAEVSEEATSFLFVQTAKGVKFEGDTMTLRGVAPSMVFFADRPDRAAGHVPTSHFVNMWSEGQDSFKADPPNANLSILGDKEGATNIVVELMNPRMEGEDITYDIKVLDGNPPKECGYVDERDNTRLIANVITQNGHKKKTYDITGPESLSCSDLAELFSNALGKKISYEDIKPKDFKKKLCDAGVPERTAEDYTEYYKLLSDGICDEVTDWVYKVTDKQPRTFDEFLDDNISFFLKKKAKSKK